MSSRLRSLDSKISFFAFADIITAVSGVLIFVALLLATDLGRPTDSHSESANPEIEQQLQETLSQQVDADARSQHLQELLASAETAPAPEKLETDIASLRRQLAEENKKYSGVAEQLAASDSAIAARDRALGLSDLKMQIQRLAQETASIVSNQVKAEAEMARIDQHVAGVQSTLLKLREREGKLWLIPDKSFTSKEPILASISGGGLKLERFDHPEQAKDFKKNNAREGFDSYLSESKVLDQYVVFLVRPSGIDLFERLVKLAREKGFEVGFDALEENREIHFTTPPPLDGLPLRTSPSNTVFSTAAARPSTFSPPQTNSAAAPPPLAKPATQPSGPARPTAATSSNSWWQRLLEFVGLA
jgi:hypothetical protein